jgi:multidrug efflux system membrane fusion protein
VNLPIQSSVARKTSHHRTYVVGVVALALVLGGYWYFSRTGDDAGSRAGGNAAPVRAMRVTRRDMAVVEHTLGTVVANTTVQVTVRVQGVIEAAPFKEGQFVRKGDLLFQIDPRPFQAALAQASAILAKDQAQLLNANRDKARYASLAQQGAISDQQRATSATNADVLTATVAADKAAVDMAALNLDYTHVRSPVDGKTGPLLVQPGNMVSSSGTVPLVTIAQVTPVKVSFSLPQSDLDRIQARQKGEGLVASLDNRKSPSGEPLAAPVDFTSNAVSGQSGTIELRANFANQDLALVPGQLVDVTVQLDTIPHALVVPRDAINDGPDGPYVYAVEKNKAVAHPVKILFDDTKNVAVSGDLKPGQQVITEGQLRVNDNGPVRVIGGKGDATQSSKADKATLRVRIPASGKAP